MAKPRNCPNCNSRYVVEGTLQSTGAVHFRPAEAKFLTFRTADVAVRSAMCAECGQITLIGDRQKLHLLFPDMAGTAGRQTEPTGAR